VILSHDLGLCTTRMHNTNRRRSILYVSIIQSKREVPLGDLCMPYIPWRSSARLQPISQKPLALYPLERSRTRTSLEPIQGGPVLEKNHSRTPCGYVSTAHDSKKLSSWLFLQQSIPSMHIRRRSFAELLNTQAVLFLGPAGRCFAARAL
jgi:hypothetical protein